jgi:nucleoside-diphosphate-sugar epimerase
VTETPLFPQRTSDWAGTRVLITGGTGFIGGALARALIQQGAEVHALARGATPTLCCQSSIMRHTADITVPETLSRVGDDFTHIIHAAGLLGRSGVPEQTYRTVNVEGTKNVMAAALRVARNARVLHVSTTGVLGPTKQAVLENSPHRPSNVYENSKAEAENIVREFAARNLSVVIARPALVYGPGDQHVLSLFQAIKNGRFIHINSGRHLCQPTFIADAVAGLLLCLKHGRVGETYHLTGPTATFRELVTSIATAIAVRPPWLSVPRSLASCAATTFELCARARGRDTSFTPSAVRFFSEDRIVSSQRAQRELGYSPAYDLATGIAETIAWYRQQRWI